MRASLALAAALLVGCTPEIVAGTETVSTTWDVDLFSLYENPTIPRFDTMDGRRQLDGMTIEVDHAAVMTVYVENASAYALEADDYTYEFYLQSIVQLGRVEGAEEDDEGPPFFGPGAFLAHLEVPLAAADEVESGGDDFYEDTLTDEIVFEAHYDWEETPTYLEAMIGEDELGLVVGGFSESWVYWSDEIGDDALLFAEASAVQYSGTMTVTYEYSPADEE